MRYSNIIWDELKVLHKMHVLTDEEYDAEIQKNLEKDEDERDANLEI